MGTSGNEDGRKVDDLVLEKKGVGGIKTHYGGKQIRQKKKHWCKEKTRRTILNQKHCGASPLKLGQFLWLKPQKPITEEKKKKVVKERDPEQQGKRARGGSLKAGTAKFWDGGGSQDG